MNLTVQPCPARAPRTSSSQRVRPRSRLVYTGTSDGAVWRLCRRRQAGRAGRRTPAAGRSARGATRRRGCVVCDAERGLLRVDPATGAVEVLVEPPATCRAASATTPPSPPTAPCGSPTPRPGSTSRLERRPHAADPHRPAAAVRARRAGRGRARRARLRQRGGALGRGGLRGGRRDRRPHRRPPLAHRARTPACATSSAPTCRATPTTSRAAATASSGWRCPARRSRCSNVCRTARMPPQARHPAARAARTLDHAVGAGAGLRRATAGWCATSTSPPEPATVPTTTPSPVSGSTTVGSG